MVRGLVNFFWAVAYLLCLALPGSAFLTSYTNLPCNRITRLSFGSFGKSDFGSPVYLCVTLSGLHCTFHFIQDEPDRLGQSNSFSSTLLVEVGDVPDEPPTFNPGLSIVDVSEDTEIGTVLFTIEAVDGDYANPMAVTYSVRQILNGSELC